MGRTKKADMATEAAQAVQDELKMCMDTPSAQEAAEGAPAASAGQQEEDTEMQTDAPLEYAVTGCGYLNLREAPSLDAPIITVLPRGVGVSDTGEIQGDWWKVTTGLLTGWVMSEYLEPVWCP